MGMGLLQSDRLGISAALDIYLTGDNDKLIQAIWHWVYLLNYPQRVVWRESQKGRIYELTHTHGDDLV